jgi:hypothetical protein
MASVLSKFMAVSKVVVALLGFILAAVNDHIDVVPVQYRGYVTGAIAVLTLVGVYHAPYAPLGAKRRSTRHTGTHKPAVSKPAEPND